MDKTKPEKETSTKIQHFFYDYPEKEYGMNELANKLKIHKSTLNKELKKLEKERFLEINQIGRMWRIKNNQKHKYNTTRKIPYHLQLIYETNIIEKILEKHPYAKSIILFGSYRKGDDISTSDIDIAVEGLENEMKITELETIKQLGHRKNVKVNSHIFHRNKINLNLFNNIANGIVLHGFLEVKP